MELIEKIKAFVYEVSNKERHEKTDFSDGKFLVSSSIQQIIKDHEPEPPKLRPMSELPEVGTSFNVYIKDDFHEKPWWQIGKQSPFRGGINSGGSYYEQSENVFKDPYTRVILGWLPLPSPNDIKL